uniref:CS047_0 protein n=1 Tax=Fopius arisanus TaxID=64838 RepID=A0A0C9RWT0_9HYME
MAKQLSSYWVKFFTNAGFPLDVATKHAVVFSNNRIKPDMLPELDKPSLKEMGITLMGDMIAILRYAKKVSEEMTCERFLVETKEISPPERVLKVSKPVVKKPLVISKVSAVSARPAPPKEPAKTLRAVSSTIATSSVQKRKVSAEPQEPQVKKRKIVTKVVEIDSDSQEEWTMQMQKRLKAGNGIAVKSLSRPPSKADPGAKKNFEQKRTVFDRLGDSSVTSTTSSSEANPTFNITGLGDVLKRNSSVFHRLGDKDAKREEKSAGILKNGSAGGNGQLQGILKSKASNMGSTLVKLKSLSSATRVGAGTMHADHERNKSTVSTSVKQLVKTTKALKLGGQRKVERKVNIKSKLASESGSLPAKARLGTTNQKQVTFNRVTTVKHIKKPGVFSRLGI